MSGLREQPPRPTIRRDCDDVTPMAPTWESLTERLIRDAVERARLTDAIAGGAGSATPQTGPEGTI
jgi:hypothetical protein